MPPKPLPPSLNAKIDAFGKKLQVEAGQKLAAGNKIRALAKQGK